METRSRKRKREIENTAEKITSHKIQQVSVRLVRLTSNQLADARAKSTADQQKIPSKTSNQSTSELDDEQKKQKHERNATAERNKVNFQFSYKSFDSKKFQHKFFIIQFIRIVKRSYWYIGRKKIYLWKTSELQNTQVVTFFNLSDFFIKRYLIEEITKIK